MPLVKCLMAITYPVSYPVSKLLDHMLGEHKLTRFSAPDLRAIIEMHCDRYFNPDLNDSEDNVKTFNPL